MAALRAAISAWRHLNHRGHIYIWANLLVVVLSLPLVTAPAAWAGLARLSYWSFRQPTVSMDEFWRGFRENLGRGVVLALLNAAVIIVNVGNLWGYRASEGTGAEFARIVWVAAPVLWLSAQFFAWPLLYAMERPSLLGALRNACVLMIRNPLYTVVVWGVVALIVGVSVVFPVAWLLLTLSALVVLSNSLVIDRLRDAGYATDVPLDQEVIPDGGLAGDIYG